MILGRKKIHLLISHCREEGEKRDVGQESEVTGLIKVRQWRFNLV